MCGCVCVCVWVCVCVCVWSVCGCVSRGHFLSDIIIIMIINLRKRQFVAHERNSTSAPIFG